MNGATTFKTGFMDKQSSRPALVSAFVGGVLLLAAAGTAGAHRQDEAQSLSNSQRIHVLQGNDDSQSDESKTAPILLRPGEGKSVWVLGDLYTFKATGEETGGKYSLLELESQPQNGPPPHIHHAEDEAFFVLEGEFSFLYGEETRTTSSGAFVHVPRGTVHTFKNVGTSTGRVLVLLVPPGFERLFAEGGFRRPPGKALRR